MSYLTHPKRFTKGGHNSGNITHRRRFKDAYTFGDTLHAVSLLADDIGGGDRLHKWMTSHEAAPLEPWTSAAVIKLAKRLARQRRRILLHEHLPAGLHLCNVKIELK
ncbi:uncharacterized protein [Rhodnius prolixus]|uniref:uncharacterized protein n=1 Tax=Rhodnius prolixus TaxID=13249 RepID=UPI000355C31E